MPRTNHRALAAVAALAMACTAWGCVSDRPSRNGVFNENQYLKKSFLIAPGDGSKPDVGWLMKSTIIATSTPNPLAWINGAGLFAGADSGGTTNLVRFAITQDKLQVLNLREISSNDTSATGQSQRVPEIVNAWPVQNVDLKYRVNLDGEKTNFYEENQELDWQVRQWVKLNLAKNDNSDLFAFGGNFSGIIQSCTSALDTSATLLPNSLVIDEQAGFFSYQISLTVPIEFTATDQPTCLAAFGPIAQPFFALGRQNVTFTIQTSFMRPPANDPAAGGYVPMPIAEKDPIQRKYGAFQTYSVFRDPNTGLLGANQYVGRFDPNKDIVYYLSPNIPDVYRQFFAGPGGLMEQTNTNILSKSGGKGRLKILNYNDDTTLGDGKGPNRIVGDPRYSFINWHTDFDNGTSLLGIAQFFTDPRTGQTMSASVNVFEGFFKDTIQQRLDAFLQTVGAEYLTPSGEFDDSKYPSSCKDGDRVPLVPAKVATQLNRQSTVYSKMQSYLQKPFAQYGYLSPSDFLPTHDTDFYNAYFSVIPYNTYADPQTNAFVTPDAAGFPMPPVAAANQWQAMQRLGEFNALAGQIDKGLAPYDVAGPTGVKDAVDFSAKWEGLAEAITDYEHTKNYARKMQSADDVSLFSYFDIYQKNGRHCVGGKWESRADYTSHLITSLNMAVAAHEFGHTLGLRHNFMGSVDQRNFPLDAQGRPTLFASSLMDYNQGLSEAFFDGSPGSPGWGPYDAAALAWIYGNNLSPTTTGPVAGTGSSLTASGQVSATAPWNDPLGFKADGKTEIPFLYCSDEHTKYTPLCRRYDMGVTPSEILSNDIQQREWNYLWTNFRLYHKFFSEQGYAANVVTSLTEMRRFMSLWAFDWSGGELTNTLRLIGVPVPAGSTAADYYGQLTAKFNTDISVANQLMATYHRAIIEQSSGERPFITVYDPFYGDVTQQGIQVDKVQATTSLTELWPAISNYDPSQAGGFYLSSVGGQVGDASYTTVSQAVLADFLGAAFATYQYAQLGPIASIAASTHSAKFGGDLRLQSWVGGWAFDRERDFLDFVRSMAVKNHFSNCDENGLNCSPCTSLDSCTWDPRPLQSRPSYNTQSDRYNRFQGPDGRTYIWGYIRSRNQWVVADKDRNIATYTLMLNWTTDVVNGEDDGFNGASPLEYKVRYVVDAFRTYDSNTLNAP